MKKLFLIICAVGLMMTGCGGGTAPNKKIIVGMDESPLGYRDAKGELVGFEVDLAKETAKRMGVALEFKLIDWDNKETELNAGNIDMIWNGMDITPERKAVMLFSKPYMDNRLILLVNKGKGDGIRALSDLDGKIVGAKAGTTSALYIDKTENLREHFAAFKTYGTDEEAFNALESGELDALICDEIIGRFEMIKNRGKLEMVDITIGKGSEMGIGFRKDDTALRDRVQKAFNEIVKDGTAKKISEKWFGANLIK